jgi:hypothetical protein
MNTREMAEQALRLMEQWHAYRICIRAVDFAHGLPRGLTGDQHESVEALAKRNAVYVKAFLKALGDQ